MQILTSKHTKILNFSGYKALQSDVVALEKITFSTTFPNNPYDRLLLHMLKNSTTKITVWK